MTVKIGNYKYNAICDVCGFKYKADMLRKRWDGLMVCPKDWEPRHPADFYRTRNDAHKLPFTRPDDSSDGSYTYTPAFNSIAGVFSVGTFTYTFNTLNGNQLKLSGIVTPTGLCYSPNESFSIPSALITAGHTINSVEGGTVIGKTTGTVYCQDFQNLFGVILMNGSFYFEEPIIITTSVITN